MRPAWTGRTPRARPPVAPGGDGGYKPFLIRNPDLPEPGHGGPFARQEHHAPQGGPGRQEGPGLRQADPRNLGLRQAGPARPGDEPAAARRGEGRARRQHDARHHRPRHQARRHGRAGRGLPGGPLRGLRPLRRRGDRRGPDRQPQPHRRRRAQRLRQGRRRAGRDQLGLLPVRAEGRALVPRPGRQGRGDAGGGDRGRRAGCRIGRGGPRGHLRAGGFLRRPRQPGSRASAAPRAPRSNGCRMSASTSTRTRRARS